MPGMDPGTARGSSKTRSINLILDSYEPFIGKWGHWLILPNCF